MIHMSQVKVPVEKLIDSAPKEYVKKGKISEEEKNLVKESIGKLLKIKSSEIQKLDIIRKSIDARKKQNILYIYQVEFTCENEEKKIRRYGKNDAKIVKRVEKSVTVTKNERKNSKLRPVVVGFGPAGMFAALELAKKGLNPLVVERGMKVDDRQSAVDLFWEKGVLNSRGNVQFGEGGAGTFSDGKLNTLVKDKSGRNRQVLKTFVEFGANDEILYLQKPHIGTDVLRDVVKNIRNKIIALGGTFYFETQVVDFVIEKNKIRQVVLFDGEKKWNEEVDDLVLATGHSARDTFYTLNDCGVYMEPKAFAIGVRVEHPQDMIGVSQYGKFHKNLPAADYKLTYQATNGRGVYSFCMCPGGYVVNASSEEGMLAVNGMSYSSRAGKNANSAIIVTVSPEDFGDGVLAGIEFQRNCEKKAFMQVNGKIPVQLLGDFEKNMVSKSFGEYCPEMKGQYDFGNVREVLPQYVGDAIIEGMGAFDSRIKGFGRKDTIISGIESRTSSPVRIVRNEFLQSNIEGIYPCGEGAGYAGGITSAAMDGIKVAEMIK